MAVQGSGEKAGLSKHSKYCNTQSKYQYYFIQVKLKTCGPFGPEANAFLSSWVIAYFRLLQSIDKEGEGKINEALQLNK